MKRKERTYFYGAQAMLFVGIRTPYMEQAIQELESYADKNQYTQRLDQLETIIEWGMTDIEKAENNGHVDYFLTAYKRVIDGIQTDAEIEADELAEAKRRAMIRLDSLDDQTRYNEPERAQLNTYIQGATQAVGEALNPQGVDDALAQAVSLIVGLKQKDYKAKKMFLNTPTYNFEEIANRRDPDLYEDESDYRLIQLYRGQFAGLTYPGTTNPSPSLKLFTMSKEEVE